jgi:hypothetical protein
MGQSPRHPKAGRWIRRPFIASRLLVASGLVLAMGTTVAVIGVGPASATATYPLWTATTAPVGLSSVKPSPDFNGLSCPATGSCVAVGQYQNDGGQIEGLIDTQSGGTWTAMAAPTGGLVPGPSTSANSTVATLNGVSCVAVGNCVAVGRYFEDDSNPQSELGLIEVLAGGTWTPLAAPTAGLSPAPGTAPAVAALDSVSCASAASCVATGTYTDGSGDIQGLIETLSAGTWTAQAAPVGGLSPADVASSDGGVQLQSVSCPAVGTCVAVGGYVASGGRQGLIETLSTGTWTPTAAPLGGLNPAPLVDEAGVLAGLAGVSCPAAGSCVAVGDYEDAAGSQPGLIETLTAGTWTATNSPTTGLGSVTAGVDLDAVSCAAAGACAAVGGFVTSTGTSQIAAVTLAGGTWTATLVSSGALSNNPAPSLSGVSCPTVGSCVADGGYTNSSDEGQGTDRDGSVDDHGAGNRGLLRSGLRRRDLHLQRSLLRLDGRQAPRGSGGGDSRGSLYGGLLGGGLRRGHLLLQRPLLRLRRGEAPGQAGGGHCRIPERLRLRLLGGGLRRGHLLLQRPLLRLDGRYTLDKPVVGMAFDAATGGYWEVASDGGIFSFNAEFYGSEGGVHLDQPVVGMAADPATGGYFEVASDGGIFTFNAPFYGSMGGKPLNKPVVALAEDPFTGGYWEVASDGGIFAFNAPFQGSEGATPLVKPVVGMAAFS